MRRISLFSAAFRSAAVGADETPFLIYEGFLSAIGAGLSAGTGAVGQIFLQRALHTHLPRID